MGLLSGKSSMSVFSVAGELPVEIIDAESAMNFLAEKIKAFSFRDIDDTFEEYSVGWVSVADKFDSRFVLSPMVGDYIVLSLRIDERKVSSAVINKFVDKEVRRIKKERQIPRISRSQKIEIKERIKTELTRKAKPAPSVFDLAWDLGEQTVIFFSTNKKAKGLLEMFFKESFGLSVCQKVPFTIGVGLVGQESMDKVIPLSIA